MMRLFDSHCHYHLGPRGILPLVRQQKATIDIINASSSSSSSSSGYDFAGAALMSTHPRDYAIVNSMSIQFNSRIETNITESQSRMKGVACYGVHPWFLHEVLDDDDAKNNKDKWLVELRQRLIDDTSAIVGEIGLDGARWRVVEMNDDEEEDNGNTNDKLLVATSYKRSLYSKLEDKGAGATTTIEEEVEKGCSSNNNNNNENDITTNNNIWERKQRILSCPMSDQKLAFESQLLLATELNRPVSIHVVQAWGELLDSFITVQDIMRRRYNNDNVHEAVEEEVTEVSTITTTATTINDLLISQKSRVNKNNKKKANKQQLQQKRQLLPPKIYFHAFSGKAGILPSLLSICARANIPKTNVYFGFAPTLPNFNSYKTPNIMKHIGIHQLLLESDLEDCTCVMDHLKAGVEGLANALDMNTEDVANVTYQNAMRFYFDE
jgi:Tat protein secretion system quality control protein TatD with DNase activity